MSTWADATVAACAAAFVVIVFVLYRRGEQHQARLDNLADRLSRLEGRVLNGQRRNDQ